jgi:hypothetical protein
MRNICLIFLVLSFSFRISFSQINIWLYDGRLITTTGVRHDSNYVYYLNNHNKIKYLFKEDVFAIIDGKDTDFFYNNPTLPPQKYFHYIKGLHDGYKYFNPWICTENFLVGTASSVLLPKLGLSGVFVAVPSLISVGVTSFSKIKKLPSTQDSLYIDGYINTARKEKLISSLTSSVAGIATGSLIVLLIKNQ